MISEWDSSTTHDMRIDAKMLSITSEDFNCVIDRSD